MATSPLRCPDCSLHSYSVGSVTLASETRGHKHSPVTCVFTISCGRMDRRTSDEFYAAACTAHGFLGDTAFTGFAGGMELFLWKIGLVFVPALLHSETGLVMGVGVVRRG